MKGGRKVRKRKRLPEGKGEKVKREEMGGFGIYSKGKRECEKKLEEKGWGCGGRESFKMGMRQTTAREQVRAVWYQFLQ